MSDLSNQKRLAADELDVGKNRVWFDPEEQGEIADAITRDDVRDLIDRDIIQAEGKRSNSRGRTRERNEKRAYGHQKGHGSRKGTAKARKETNNEWRGHIRAQRRRLRELRDEGDLSSSAYRELYNKAGGGEFDSVGDLERYITEHY
jgi:large subunit ribosomal protein L19e